MSPLRVSHHTRPAFRRHTPHATTRRGATCDARPTAGRQRNRPHACARHPGDMNVAPTCIPRLSHHTRPAFHRRHAAQTTTRRGATCDARPTAGRQRNRPHACVRHPGDMNVAPTFIPRLSHHTRPAFRRRHPGDMNVAPTFIPTFITRHQPARPAFHRRPPGDMNVAPTFTLRLPHVYPITRSRHFAATTRAT